MPRSAVSSRQVTVSWRSCAVAARRHSHGQAAGEQDGGVGGAGDEFGVLGGDAEHLRIETAIDSIGNEQRGEEQYFAHQENPHADADALARNARLGQGSCSPAVCGMSAAISACLIERGCPVLF